jgi:penicillin G amidase
MLSRALAKGVATLRERLGGNLEAWQWRRKHQARPRHTLSAVFPELAELLEPPAIPMSGDGDTPLAGSYSPAEPATVTGLSAARYAFDLSNWNNSLWAVPLGSSGHPGSPHYHDQSETWRQVQMVPMQYDWNYISAHRETKQQLEPP